MGRSVWRVLGVGLCALACSCAAPESRPGTGNAEPLQLKSLDDPRGSLENVFLISNGVSNGISNGVYSGSGPEGDDAFDTLADFGVRTIVSVDGASPDVEAARVRGIRYIHLPVGYDGIDAQRTIELAKAIDLPGAVYIHCHHGKHRGPAATAVGLIALGHISTEHGEAFLNRAGTSESYPGLWSCVRETEVIEPGDLDQAPADLPEVQTVSGLVETMVEIDRVWSRLKAIRGAGWHTPPDHPDLAPAAEAGMLADHFRTLLDDEEAHRQGDDFLSLARESFEAAAGLESAINAGDVDQGRLDRFFIQVRGACLDCHASWRN